MSRPPTVHNAYGRCAYRPSRIIGHCSKRAVATDRSGALRHRKVRERIAGTRTRLARTALDTAHASALFEAVERPDRDLLP